MFFLGDLSASVVSESFSLFKNISQEHKQVKLQPAIICMKNFTFFNFLFIANGFTRETPHALVRDI